MSKKTRNILFALLVVAVIVAGYFTMRSRADQASDVYDTEKVTRGNLVATVGATGTVRSNQSAVLIWQASGTVGDVFVKVGDKIQAGDQLASLLRTSLPQNIILAEADLLNAQRSLDDLLLSKTPAAQAYLAYRDAQDRYDSAMRYRRLLNSPYTVERVKEVDMNIGGQTIKVAQLVEEQVEPTAADIEESEAQLALREAQLGDAQRAWERIKDGPNTADVAVAEARVAAAQAALNMASVIAPFDGTITDLNPAIGDQVNAGSIAFRLDDLSRLLVDVEVSEVDINNINVGQQVTLSFDAILGEQYTGTVINVGKVGNNLAGIVSFTVTVELNEVDERVKPGMTAAVNIVIKELQDVILIPNRAVRNVDGNRVVYLLKDGLPEMVEVRLGSSSDNMSVVVSDNLDPGDVLILNPPADFGNGGGPPFMGR